MAKKDMGFLLNSSDALYDAKRALRLVDPSDDEWKEFYKKLKGAPNGQTYYQRAISYIMSHAKTSERDYRKRPPLVSDNAKKNNSLKRKRKMENVIVIDSDSDDDRQRDTSLKKIKKHGNSDVPAQRLPCKGFNIPSQVPVERERFSTTPLLVHCPAGDGGVQGLNWYAKSLRIDEDNDMANEFLVEVLPDTSNRAQGHNRRLPTFELNHNTRRAKVTNKILKRNFQNIHTSKEHA